MSNFTMGSTFKSLTMYYFKAQVNLEVISLFHYVNFYLFYFLFFLFLSWKHDYKKEDSLNNKIKSG